MTEPESEMKEQLEFLLRQYNGGSVSIHQLMTLIGMAYKDYLDFHPEERPVYYDPDQLEQCIRRTRTLGQATFKPPAD